MARSPERQAEIRTMDAIELAMSKIDDLTEPAQVRVRRWVAETYCTGMGVVWDEHGKAMIELGAQDGAKT